MVGALPLLSVPFSVHWNVKEKRKGVWDGLVVGPGVDGCTC